jgi:PEP-CTERM motif
MQTASATAVAAFMMAASASASTIAYTTNSAGTEFFGDGLTLNSTGGAAAVLTFHPNTSSISGVPSNINFGNFGLVCATCGTQASGLGTLFNSFTFDLVVDDTTDGATGEFVGPSTGGTVWSDVSNVAISWAPAQLGPGTTGALSGSFGGTDFTISTPTGIVAPNSGTTPGVTTVQGTVDAATGVPEPSTFVLIGGALLGLSARRRKTTR